MDANLSGGSSEAPGPGWLRKGLSGLSRVGRLRRKEDGEGGVTGKGERQWMWPAVLTLISTAGLHHTQAPPGGLRLEVGRGRQQGLPRRALGKVTATPAATLPVRGPQESGAGVRQRLSDFRSPWDTQGPRSNSNPMSGDWAGWGGAGLSTGAS